MRKVRKALAAALSLLGQKEAELSVLFVGSRKMKTLNTLYRGIPKETDVLSFPLHEVWPVRAHEPRITNHDLRPLVLGDIVISVPRTLEQAKAYRVSVYGELLRLLIHGLLHLLGYDHEKSSYQKARMEKMEKEILHAVARLD